MIIDRKYQLIVITQEYFLQCIYQYGNHHPSVNFKQSISDKRNGSCVGIHRRRHQYCPFSLILINKPSTRLLTLGNLAILHIIIPNVIMIYSKQSSSWRECCQHQQQIAILQQKLMQIHNKLIDQLDVCKEQELTIIDLNKKLTDSNAQRNTAFDTFKYQSFGQHSQSSKENETPNYKIHYNHDSRDSYQTKTELLQADLEAMRNKVLMEITEKNKLKEEIKEIRNGHKKETALQVKKFQGLESLLRKIQEENQQLRDKYDRVKRDYRSQSDLEKLMSKLGELQTRYQKEKDSNRELTEENIQLTEKIDELEKEVFRYERQYKSKERKLTYHEEHASHNYKESQSLKTTVKANKKDEYREIEYQREQRERELREQRELREKREERERKEERERREERGQDKRKKRGFEQTKELIKKLQEAEINMRKNRKPT